MKITSEKARIEYIRKDLFNDRIKELQTIGDIPVQIEPSPEGFIVEFMEGKQYINLPTVSAKLKAARAQIKRLEKENKSLTERNAELLRRDEARGKEKDIAYSYDFMLLSAIHELGRILGGLPKEFCFLLKRKRYGDFEAAKREYFTKAGIDEKNSIEEKDIEQ